MPVARAKNQEDARGTRNLGTYAGHLDFNLELLRIIGYAPIGEEDESQIASEPQWSNLRLPRRARRVLGLLEL